MDEERTDHHPRDGVVDGGEAEPEDEYHCATLATPVNTCSTAAATRTATDARRSCWPTVPSTGRRNSLRVDGVQLGQQQRHARHPG